MSNFQAVIGLEVHVQLQTKSKMFCGCPNLFAQPPNTLICPVCTGLPGVLPVLNKKTLAYGIRTALALNCSVQKNIIFERKNYFYPDLPKGYQISQYVKPLGENGCINIDDLSIRVRRVHLEEDAGKLIHKENYSLVDLNRTGVPLLEIVSEPDITTAQQAYDYLSKLKLILQYIGVSTCDMEKGFLRCDANVSVRPEGENKMGIKTELKNMNSFRQVREGLDYEIKRQKKDISEGKKIVQETRLWNEKKKRTEIMRTKEEAHDYRYFPEPDLVCFNLQENEIQKEKDNLGELPGQKRERFNAQYKLEPKELEVFISSPELADFFENCTKQYSQYRKVVNWILGPFLGALNEKGIELKDVKVTPENFAALVKMVNEGKITNLVAKDLLSDIMERGGDPEKIVEEKGLASVSGKNELEGIVDEVIKENPKPVDDFKQGKKKAVMFLVGQVMKKTRGKANPGNLKEIFLDKLKK